MTNNKTVIKWLDDMKALLTPDNIVWVDGSDEQRDELRDCVPLECVQRLLYAAFRTGKVEAGEERKQRHVEDVDELIQPARGWIGSYQRLEQVSENDQKDQQQLEVAYIRIAVFCHERPPFRKMRGFGGKIQSSAERSARRRIAFT